MPNLGGGGGGRTPRFLSTFSPTQSLHCSEQSWKIRPVITLLQASDDKNGCSPTLWQTRGPSFHSWVTEQPTWNLTLWGLLVSWPQNQNKSFWFRYSSKQSDESEMSPASFVMCKICNVEKWLVMKKGALNKVSSPPEMIKKGAINKLVQLFWGCFLTMVSILKQQVLINFYSIPKAVWSWSSLTMRHAERWWFSCDVARTLCLLPCRVALTFRCWLGWIACKFLVVLGQSGVET